MKNKKELLYIFKCDEGEFPVYLIKKPHQKNVYCRFKDNYFEITCSYFSLINNNQIENLVNSLYKKIKKQGYFNKKEENKNSFYCLGKKYEIIDNYFLDDFNHQINVKNKDNFIKVNAIKEISEHYEYYRKLMNVPQFYKLSFRNMKTRLGTNSRKTKKITLSTTLFPYNIEIIDSVIVHELAHYYVFNHSKKFYDIVYKYSPSYKELRKKILRGEYI